MSTSSVAINTLSSFPEPERLRELLRDRLALPLPGLPAQERMTGRVLPMPPELPTDARPSAVLLLLFPKEGQTHLLFIRRSEDGKAHGGQIALPGGKMDSGDADLRATALRETGEEVGVKSGDIDILGALTPLYIPVSRFIVHPFVGWTHRVPDYLLSTAEVSSVHEIPLSLLLDPKIKTQTEVRPGSLPTLVLHVPAYRLPGIQVPLWGATAMIVSELEVLMDDLRPGLV